MTRHKVLAQLKRAQANARTAALMFDTEPVLADVRAAGEVVPGLERCVILTSGRPLPFGAYGPGQRRALVYGALFEGLAPDEETAERLLQSGRIKIGACHDHGCVGSVAGIYTASMPVFVVKNANGANVAFCNLYEGESRRRLNYGVYDDDVRAGLVFLEQVVAPVLRQALQHSGGIPLKPIIRRALSMGDELHSRNTAASALFTRELFPYLLEAGKAEPDLVRRTVAFLQECDYFFLRLSMAAAKLTADAAHGIEASSVVTALALGSTHFAIRVSGLTEWIPGPLPGARVKLFDGYAEDDIEWLGGESCITETVGLGGFAQAAAFPLQRYQGGTAAAMIRANTEMYRITVAENPDYKIPFLNYRGTPTGIDIFSVTQTGILPVIDAGVAGRQGGQIGAGTLIAPMECFTAAIAAYQRRYGLLTRAPA